MKTLKNLLLLGNDWLLHVSLSATNALLFGPIIGWWTLVISFLSHFAVDAIPHGHIESKVLSPAMNNMLDGLKGILLGGIIFIYMWIKKDFDLAFFVGMNMFVGISYDLLLTLTQWLDKKEKFLNFDFLINDFNFFCHWFGKSHKMKKWWKKKEVYNCGSEGNGFVVSWWNILQLILSVPLLIYIFSF